MRQSVKDSSGSSPFVVKIQKDVRDEFEHLRAEQLTPWAFLHSNDGVKITNRRGRTVSYQGVEFDGSPSLVFWNAFHIPVIEDIISEQFESILSLCVSAQKYTEKPLDEVAGYLRSHAFNYLNDMVNLDRGLRGKGQPEKVAPRSVDREKESIDATITGHLSGARSRLKAYRPSWGLRNQWWIQTGISVIAGGIAGAAGAALFK